MYTEPEWQRKYGTTASVVCALIGGVIAVVAFFQMASAVYVGTMLLAFVAGAVAGAALAHFVIYILPIVLGLVLFGALMVGGVLLLIWVLSIRII